MAFIDKVSPKNFNEYVDKRQNAIVDNDDVELSRALNVEYQNTGERPILVLANIYCELYVSTDINLVGWVWCRGEVGVTSPLDSGDTVSYDDLYGEIYGLNDDTHDFSVGCWMIFIVPVNSYYRIETGKTGHGQDAMINSWIEIPL